MTPANAEPRQTSPGPAPHQSARRFWLALAAICALGLLFRLAILDEFLRENPIAERPWMDGWVYWQMAGEMAQGQWTQNTPFLSAPLYPYCLGVIRTLGGDLPAVYFVQLVLHLVTALLLGWATRIRFSTAAGLLATALFLALTEPAISSTRIVANTLQLLLATLLWWRWVVLIDRGRPWRDVVVVGALTGLFALAYPPAILLIPLFALWLWWHARRNWSAAARALVGAACGLLVISPATLHNLLLHGELIPITAHAGITLRQGNGSHATGGIGQIPGISLDREEMHADAARVFAAAHGREGTWREIDAHFRREALQYWLHNPLASLTLFASKFYYYLTWMNYDDMMPTVLEREYGIADRAWLAPLPIPWLLGAAFIGAAAALRRPLRRLPELILFLLPLLVVLAFFYIPRYRLAGTPMFCVLAAVALTQFRSFRCSWTVCLPVFLLPPLLTVLNMAIGVDSPDLCRRNFTRYLSRTHVILGDRHCGATKFEEALPHYLSAVEVFPESAKAHQRLGGLYIHMGDLENGARELERAVACNPTDEQTQGRLKKAYRSQWNLYCSQGRFSLAADAMQRLLSLPGPDDARAHMSLAWLRATCPDQRVRDGPAALQHAQAGLRLAGARYDTLDILAATYAELGRFDEAIATGVQALRAARQQADPARITGIQRRIEGYRQKRPHRTPPP